MKSIIIGCIILVGWLAAGTAYYTCKTHCRCGVERVHPGATVDTREEVEPESTGTTTTEENTVTSDSTASSGIEMEEGNEPDSSGTTVSDTETETEPEEIRLEGESLTRKTLYCNYKSPHFEEDDQLSEYATDILKYLESHPGSKVYIIGHTDNVGGIWYNRRLGRERAQNFSNFLADHDIPRDRMVVDTEGKAQPIADNGTEAGRKQNRRVEIIIK